MSKERELLQRLVDSGVLGGYSFIAEVKELLAQPEQNNTQYLLEQVSRLTAENAMLKEKWSAPKREPLSDEAVCAIFPTIVGEVFVDLVRIIEKAHCIGVDDE